MVLRRVLVTALSALGLIALTARTVVGQTPEDGTQIPAPKLYSDISACAPTTGATGNAPANATRRRQGNPSHLDAVFNLFETNGTRSDIATSGAAYTAFTDTYNGEGCEAGNAVVGGFSEALLIANRVRAFGPPTEGAAPLNPELYQQALADQAAYAGTIYDAVVAQQTQSTAVTEAITAYNTFLGASSLPTDGSIPVLYDAAWTAYGNIDVTGFDATDDPNSPHTIGNPYGTNGVQGFQGFTVNANTGLIDLASGTAGATTLSVDIDGDSNNDISGQAVGTFAGIEAGLRTANEFLKTAGDNLSDAREGGSSANTIANLQDIVASAQRVVDHFNSEKVRLSGLALQSQASATAASENRTALQNFSRANSHAAQLEQAVRSAVIGLQNARDAVNAGLQDPDDYLDQLVARRRYQKAEADETGSSALIEEAQKALTMAENQRNTHLALTGGDDDNPANALLNSLLQPRTAMGGANPADDDGQALLDAISSNYEKIKEVADSVPDAMDTSAITSLTTDVGTLKTDVESNDGDIENLDGRVTTIEGDIYGDTAAQHDGLAACDATGLINVANCADARSRHNEADIEEVNDKLMQKKEYIDNLAAEIGVDPVTGEGTGEGGMSRIDMNAAAIDAEEKARMDADTALGGRIDAEAMARADADTALGGRIDAEAMARADADMALGMRIDGEAMARADADVMLGGMISAEEMARMEADAALGGRISSNAADIAAAMNSIGSNTSMINDNRAMIGELSDDLDVVRAGVAASMALAGMPAINGRGISIGVGSYDGESAFAVGFQIQGEQASFKVGVTSSGGETGASAGVGFNF